MMRNEISDRNTKRLLVVLTAMFAVLIGLILKAKI
jgi:hypothetical protein